jgi:hypothetical protein
LRVAGITVLPNSLDAACTLRNLRPRDLASGALGNPLHASPALAVGSATACYAACVPVDLDHLIVRSRDKRVSATFLAEMLGLPPPTAVGPGGRFHEIRLAGGTNHRHHRRRHGLRARHGHVHGPVLPRARMRRTSVTPRRSPAPGLPAAAHTRSLFPHAGDAIAR